MDEIAPKLEKELKLRREIGDSMDFNDVRDLNETPSFEHFLMIGIPPNYDGKTKPKPQVLLLYPYYPLKIPESEFEQVIDFAFPNGIHEIEPSDGHQPAIIDEFSFCFTKNTGTLYGCCVHFRIIEGLDYFFATENNKNYLFCLCMLTREPFFGPHYNFLTYLVKTLIGWTRDISIETLVEKINVPEGVTPTFLPHMTKLASFARWEHMKIFKFFILNIQAFYHLRRGKAAMKWKEMNVEYPDVFVSQQESIGCSTLDLLFSMFTLDNIIKILTAVLIEHQVIVISKRAYRCSNTILAVRCLLYPFKLTGGGFLPILPNAESYLGILGSPTPIFLGVLKTDSLDLSVVEEPKCIVDVDNGTVSDPALKLTLFNASKIRSDLAYYIESRRANIEVPARYKIKQGKRVKNQEWIDFFENVSSTAMPAHFISQTKQKFVFDQ